MKVLQNLRGRKIAIILFPSNRLPTVQEYEEKLRQALTQIKPGDFVDLTTRQDTSSKPSEETLR